MNGLLKHSFYGIKDGVKIVLIFLFILGVILLITGNAIVLNLFSWLSAPIFALLAYSSLRKGSASKWQKYQLTLPVKRSELIKAQYISHLYCSLCGMLLVVFFMALAVLLHGNQYFYYGLRDAITLVFGGGMIAMLIGVIAYPLYYLWGAERNEIILVLSVVGAIGIVLALSLVINWVIGDDVSNLKYYISLFFMLSITALAFGLSYFLSCQIFRHKEY